MDKKEYESMISKTPQIRYEYFIKKAADNEEVWGLYNEGWATAEDDLGNELIPFFPLKEFAQGNAVGDWTNYTAEPIPLEELIEDWLPGMKEDGIKPSIFPTDEDTAILTIDDLIRDLLEEMEKYQ